MKHSTMVQKVQPDICFGRGDTKIHSSSIPTLPQLKVRRNYEEKVAMASLSPPPRHVLSKIEMHHQLMGSGNNLMRLPPALKSIKSEFSLRNENNVTADERFDYNFREYK